MKLTTECVVACVAWLAVTTAVSPLIGGQPTTIRLEGCRIKPAHQVTLSVNQSGVLDSVPQEGDPVEVGQKVILLEDGLARAALAVAEKEATNDVDIRHAKAASEVARAEYEQMIEINERSEGAVTLADTRRAKFELDRSLLQIEQAKHKLVVATLKRHESAAQLRAFYVVSPVVGTVNKVMKHKGEAVRQGEPILELVNTRRVRVEGFLDVVHRGQVRPGTAVQVEPKVGVGSPATARAFGKIVFVDSVVQPVTNQVRIWADVENVDELLLPGLTAIMTISLEFPPVVTTRR